MAANAPGKTILIIGGGVAGLAAGCYAQMNGFKATILEMHNVAGGLCTAWRRKGYTFDISMHMVTHSRQGGFLRMWRELGMIQGRTLVDHPDRGLYEIDGERCVIPSNLDAFEAWALARSPRDGDAIRELVHWARTAAAQEIAFDKPVALMGWFEMVRWMVQNWGVVRFMGKVGRIPLKQYAMRFQDPLLRATILSMEESVSWPMVDVPLASYLMVLGMGHNNNISYLVGGSYAGAQAMAQRFAALGGTLRLRTRVAGILTEADEAGDRAVGVRLADGTELRADYVISAADGRTTLWEWLGGRYLSEPIANAYRTWKVFPPLVTVMLGVARPFADEPCSQSFPLAAPIRVANSDYRRMDCLLYNYDPTMAPEGKTAVQVWYTTEYEWWRQLAEDRVAYEAEKARLADDVIAALDARWPGLREQVEVVDVATPVTFRRYTGNEQGSPDGWCMTVASGFSALPQKLPGLSHFYMTGQWTMPFAGVPGSCMTGRDAIQYICRDEKRTFVTSEPPADWRPVACAAPNDDERAAAQVRSGGRLEAVAIDGAACSGCGDCTVEAPTVFHLEDDGLAHVADGMMWPHVEAVVAAAVRRALERCPEQAIHVVERVEA